MPDISLCTNTDCPLKEVCYRQTAVPNPYRQSYSKFKLVKDEEKGVAYCEMFIDNKEYK